MSGYLGRAHRGLKQGSKFHVPPLRLNALRVVPSGIGFSHAAPRNELRPAQAAQKATYAASMSSVPITMPVPNMSAGTGSIRVSHMAPLSTVLPTRHKVSNVAVIDAAQARAACWVLQCSN